MNTALLNNYKNISIPNTSLYRKETDKEGQFRKTDSPLAFLDLSKDQQLTLLKWCQSLDKVEKINLRHSSYGIKHMFEREGYGFYVKNGAMKGAFLLAGFSISDVNDLNWQFNVSEKSIKNMLKTQEGR